MPALSADSRPLVLVTGANGYIASHIILRLLEAGYRVRGTVRSTASIAPVKSSFAQFGDALEVLIIPDLTAPRVFEDALEGVNGIIHVASPAGLSYDGVDATIKPAVQGTLNILRSAQSYPSISRVVICSSGVAIHPPPDNIVTPTIYSEEDWNELSPEIVKEHGDETDFQNIYSTSKVLADKATWKFYDENQDKLEFDLVALHPTIILGPVIYDVKSPEHLNGSSLLLWNVLTQRMTPLNGWHWIDARDCAQLFVRALQTPEAGGNRIILTSGPLVFQDLLDIANTMTPPIYTGLPEKVLGGDTGVTTDTTYKLQFNVEKGRRILGMGTTHRLKTKEEMMRDTLERFKALGFEI